MAWHDCPPVWSCTDHVYIGRVEEIVQAQTCAEENMFWQSVEDLEKEKLDAQTAFNAKQSLGNSREIVETQMHSENIQVLVHESQFGSKCVWIGLQSTGEDIVQCYF